MIKLVKDIIRKRTIRMVDAFNDFIVQGKKVLDIGAGGGWIAKEIKRRKAVDITLLDIIDFNRTSLKYILYDGKSIPFLDNDFDISFLIFTLHHCSVPQRILKEAKRVTKDKIIIIEDIPTSWFNKAFLCFWDVLTNLPSLVKPPGENIFFNFKTPSEWQKVFKELQLNIVFEKTFSSNKFINHRLFVLQK